MTITGQARRALCWGVPVAITLVMAAVAAGLWIVADRRDGAPPANRALVDARATSTVIGAVSAGIAKIFSYSYADPAATERVAKTLLTGTAADQYRALFTQVARQAPRQRLTLATRVARAGVIQLGNDSARLLVFVDQVATREGRPAGRPVTAELMVTAQRRGGTWRISELHTS